MYSEDLLPGRAVPQVGESYIYFLTPFAGFPAYPASVGIICWRKLMRTPGLTLYCKGGLNHSCKILLSPSWQFSNVALLLVYWEKIIENRTRICLTLPISKDREANMSLSYLREQRNPWKNFCVSASCATLCMQPCAWCELVLLHPTTKHKVSENQFYSACPSLLHAWLLAWDNLLYFLDKSEWGHLRLSL